MCQTTPDTSLLTAKCCETQRLGILKLSQPWCQLALGGCQLDQKNWDDFSIRLQTTVIMDNWQE